MTKEKRKKIVALCLKHMKILDPTNSNHDRYKKMFDGMSDAQFKQWSKNLVDGKEQIYMLFPNMKTPMKIANALESAKDFDYEVCQPITRVDEITGKKYTTGHDYLILKLPVRRTKQILKRKISVAQSDKTTDLLTGQVVKPDKSSAISQVESQILYSKGLNKTLEELVNVRGGNSVKYSQLNRQLQDSGEASLAEIEEGSVSQSTVTAAVMLTSMMLKHNLIEGGNL